MSSTDRDSGESAEVGRFSDQQIRRVARFMALLKLATERGLADRTQLRRWLTPAAYELQFHPAATRFLGGSVPTPADLGATLSVPGSGRVEFAIAARETTERWGALRIALQVTPAGRLRVTELLRSQDHWLAVSQQPAIEPPTVDELQRQARGLLAARQLARRTHEIAVARLAALPGGPKGDTARAMYGPEAERWAAHLECLDAGLAQLMARLDPSATSDSNASRTRLLGAEPHVRSPAWDQWREAYLELGHYQGWGRKAVSTPHGLAQGHQVPSPLKPLPTGPRLEL